MCATLVLGLTPRWRRRSISRMMLIKGLAYVFILLIFLKRFKIAALYLIYIFPQALAFHVCNNASGYGPMNGLDVNI